MSDETNSDAQNDEGNDPLQANAVIEEAFEVSDDEARSESEEGSAVEALSRSFEDYVRTYQDSWQQAWQDSIEAYEQDVQNWQHLIAGFQGGAPTPQQQPTPPPTPKTPSTTKSKPQKSRS